MKNIVPFLDITTTNVKNTSNKLVPIAGSNYVHRIYEVDRKKEDLNPLERISSYVVKKRKESQIFTPDRMILIRKRKKRRVLPNIIHLLNTPKNENYYTKFEVLNILSSYTKYCRSPTR